MVRQTIASSNTLTDAMVRAAEALSYEIANIINRKGSAGGASEGCSCHSHGDFGFGLR